MRTKPKNHPPDHYAPSSRRIWRCPFRQRCISSGAYGAPRLGHIMSRILGLSITLFAFALTGLVAAQDLPPAAQTAPLTQSIAPGGSAATSGAPGVPPRPMAAKTNTQTGGSEKRIALVIGNASYQTGALKTAANDGGLIAQTLQAAGFDVVGARDLDQEGVRRALRDFLDKAQNSGPDTVAFLYLAGYGVQLEGENYFVPVDAKLAHPTDVPVEAVRVADYIRPLATLGLKAGIVVLDTARANAIAKFDPPLAGGLALVEGEPGMMIAFNAAPGTVAPDGQGPYGAYAQALAEMIREGGLPLTDLFDRVRLRVNQITKGAEVPWQANNIKAPFVFFERTADAPPPTVSPQQTDVRGKAIRDMGVQDAYAAVLERDTLEGYSEFLAAYPNDPMSARVRAIAAARREAVTWERSRSLNTQSAYWTYLRRYPHGPHATDAQRLLTRLGAPTQPTTAFIAADFDIPPPPAEEARYVERPVLAFDDPAFAFPPPPPPPIYYLPPPPPYWVVLPPPPPPFGVFLLPVPVFTPFPLWVRPPIFVAAPVNNIYFSNIHNTVIVNNVTRNVTITTPGGQTTTQPVSAFASRTGLSPGIGPSLPPSVQQRASLAQPGATTPTGLTPGQQSRPLGQPLPGANGQQVPATQQANVRPNQPSRPAQQSSTGQVLSPSTKNTAATNVTPGPLGATQPNHISTSGQALQQAAPFAPASSKTPSPTLRTQTAPRSFGAQAGLPARSTSRTAHGGGRRAPLVR
jgi:uncharacterized caspase-like protein